MNIRAFVDESAERGDVWIVKRLAANDTLASGAHQAGPYLPKAFLFHALPALNDPKAENPDIELASAVNGAPADPLRAIWYNNRLRGGTRDEARLTRFGGSSSPFLDPDSTGSLAVLSFAPDGPRCSAWVCLRQREEEAVETIVGIVEPGSPIMFDWSDGTLAEDSPPSPCSLAADEMPISWREAFPSLEETVREATERASPAGDPSERLRRRRECEFALFESIERAIWLPKVRKGFQSMAAFLEASQSVLQRRKARSGRSLELHLKQILEEEGLVEGESYSFQATTEHGTRPDFLFPSEDAYRDPAFPSERLRMLAVKTTARDRWRQVIDEAERISSKHLLTLQEGVSENQFAQMRLAGVKLVVPTYLTGKYPASVREGLVTLEAFLSEVTSLSATQ